MLSAFSDAAVEYLLVGAYALAVYGLPRATGDIDFWVRRSKENAGRVVRALSVFGAPLSAVGEKDFEMPDMVFQIGVAPHRVDIMTSVSGVEFEEAWRERIEVVIEGITVPVISRRHLIANKRSVGRAKDEVDAAWLEENPE